MYNLSDMCDVELDSIKESEFIGINIYKGDPKIIFPRGYRLSNDKYELRKDIMLLIKVLDKYKSRKNSTSYSELDHYSMKGKGSNFPFANALWLIKDFECNGLYKEYIHKYKIDKKGSINWGRTIKTQLPYLSNKGLFYLDYIVREKHNDVNNVILLMHKYIIEKCIDNIGWLYPSVSIDRGNKLPFSIGICINTLKKELRLSNLDSKKKLINNMIDFLMYVGNDKSTQKLKEYKTKYFMNIWEDMLKVVFGNEDEKNYYPNAIWNIDDKNFNASNLRPDVILKMENKVYVIDAKYYKYGITHVTSDLPQSADITKQLLYSSHIKSDKGMDAYDAFVLPYDGKDNDILKFVGNASIDIKEFMNKKVVCILADMKKMMELYINMSNLDKYKKDIQLIIDKEDSINKNKMNVYEKEISQAVLAENLLINLRK